MLGVTSCMLSVTVSVLTPAAGRWWWLTEARRCTVRVHSCYPTCNPGRHPTSQGGATGTELVGPSYTCSTGVMMRRGGTDSLACPPSLFPACARSFSLACCSAERPSDAGSLLAVR